MHDALTGLPCTRLLAAGHHPYSVKVSGAGSAKPTTTTPSLPCSRKASTSRLPRSSPSTASQASSSRPAMCSLSSLWLLVESGRGLTSGRNERASRVSKHARTLEACSFSGRVDASLRAGGQIGDNRAWRGSAQRGGPSMKFQSTSPEPRDRPCVLSETAKPRPRRVAGQRDVGRAGRV